MFKIIVVTIHNVIQTSEWLTLDKCWFKNVLFFFSHTQEEGAITKVGYS